MLREISFRGKKISNGEWVYGSFHKYNDHPGIVAILENVEAGAIYSVEPETVGQYTGLDDKEGKPIYEGDILKGFSASVPCYEVFYSQCMFRLRYKLKSGEFYDWGPLYRLEEILKEEHLKMYPEVIGNIHDNHGLIPQT